MLLAEHEYTEANLAFEHLKGTDRAMARALSTCRALDAHLVLVTRRVTGGTDSPCCYKRRRWYDDDEDSDDEDRHHTMTDVSERGCELAGKMAVASARFADGNLLNFNTGYRSVQGGWAPNESPIRARGFVINAWSSARASTAERSAALLLRR